jgi:hypothetical protein
MISACRNTPRHAAGLEELLVFARSRLACSLCAEVGCYAGEATVAFAHVFTVVYAVDPWSDDSLASMHQEGFGARPSDVELSFDERTANLPGVIKWKEHSVTAAKRMRHYGIGLDLVYIDALHDYASVQADIAAWLPTLRSDRPSIICGHDYCPQYPGVIQAVDERFGPLGLQHFSDGSWLRVMEADRA